MPRGCVLSLNGNGGVGAATVGGGYCRHAMLEADLGSIRLGHCLIQDAGLYRPLVQFNKAARTRNTEDLKERIHRWRSWAKDELRT